MTKILQVTKLHLSLDNQPILIDLSFDISEGDFVAILGPNGSGKTSLLNCINTHYETTDGQIQLKGKSLNSFTKRQRARTMATLHQQPPTNLKLSVEEVIELGLIPHLPFLGWSNKDERQIVTDVMDQIGLTPFRHRSFDSLSGGEQQRTLIAKVMVQRPQLLLMDEPTNHLDIHYQIDVMSIAKNLGITVIACIHDLNLAASYCNKVICLNEGRISFQGKPEAELNSDNLQAVYKVPSVVDSNPLNGQPRISFDLMRAQTHEC